MEIVKKYKYTILSVIILLVLAILGFSYAYTKSNVTVVSETQTIIRSKKLALTFNDTKQINVNDMMPGKVVEKTFNVKSDADEELKYNIKWKDVTNTYKEDVVYTLIRDGEVVVQQTPMAKTNPEEYILTNIKIESLEKHEYILKIEYLITDEEQRISSEDIFAGTVEIDVIDKKAELIYVPYTTNEISSSNITEENTITNEFTVRNTSATQTQTYNVLLEDIESEYDSGELTYSLEKNGKEISSGNIENEIMYLTTDETLVSGKTDKYELTIKENIDNTLSYEKERYKFSLLSSEIASNSLSKKINAKIVIDKKEVDVTKPECNITGNTTEWVTSATLKIVGTDEGTGLAKNAYSWDGINYSSTNTLNVTKNGTYTAYVKDKIGNVSNCNVSVEKVDSKKPSITFSSASSNAYKILINYNVKDEESKIISTTCKYGTTNGNYSLNSTSVTNTQCVINEVAPGKTFYYQICTKDSANNESCYTNSLATKSITYSSLIGNIIDGYWYNNTGTYNVIPSSSIGMSFNKNQNFLRQNLYISGLTGHKIYAYIKTNKSSTTVRPGLYLYSSNVATDWPTQISGCTNWDVSTTINNWVKVGCVLDVQGVYISQIMYAQAMTDAVGTAYYSNLILIDITALFGAGNEPSLEWCNNYLNLG